MTNATDAARELNASDPLPFTNRFGTHGAGVWRSYRDAGVTLSRDQYEVLHTVWETVAAHNAAVPGYWSSGPTYTGAENASYWLSEIFRSSHR